MSRAHLDKRRRLPSLGSLRAFEAAARCGSFKRAAAELAVTPTAVSHQIRSLEEQLGLALFERQVRKVALTEVGAALFPVLRDGFDSFETALERLAQARKRAQVRISATGAFTAKWLVPRVANFQRLHPGIDMHLHASDEAVDLDDSDIDLAVRYGRGPYPGLVAEPMFADRFAPVANPSLGVRALADLATAPLIHFQWKRKHALNPTWEAWFERAGLPWSALPSHLHFSDEGHAIQAAVAGQGVALLSLALVGSELAAGQLMQPFGPIMDGHIYHLVKRADGEERTSVRAAFDWLRSEAEASLDQKPDDRPD